MTRRQFVIGTAAAAALAACGREQVAAPPSAASAPAGAASSAPAASASAALSPTLGAPQGVTASTILVGASMPTTGPIAGAGQSLSNGLKIAVGVVNDAGGIKGRKITANILDDQYSTPNNVANNRKLVSEDKVYAIVDPVGTNLIPASWPFIKESGIPFFAPISPGDPQMDNVFLLGAAIRDQAAVEMEYVVSKGYKTVGIVYLEGAFGDAEKEGFTAVLNKHPEIKVVSQQTVGVTDLNMAPYVVNAQKANPEAFLLGCANTQSYLFLKGAADNNWKPVFIGNGNTVTTPEISKLASAEGVISTAISQPLDSPNPEIKKFKDAAAKFTPGVDPTLQTLQSYGNAIVFFHILETTNDWSWKGLIKATEAIKNYETGIYPQITFGPLPNGHSAARGSLLTQLKSGTFTPLTGKFVEPSV